MNVFYLCNGTCPTCKKHSCYLNGGACRTTTDVKYAKNFEFEEHLDGNIAVELPDQSSKRNNINKQNNIDIITCNILGTEYIVLKKKYKDDSFFKENKCSGYCDRTNKKIIYCDMKTYPGFKKEDEKYLQFYENETLRHEIMHAFLDESGLIDNSYKFDDGWAQNEEMVGWFAIQSPKIFKTFKELDII